MSGRLFEPLRLGHLALTHRVVMAPLTRLRADENHIPQPVSVKYYEQRESVPGSLIISESTQISLEVGGAMPRGYSPTPRSKHGKQSLMLFMPEEVIFSYRSSPWVVPLTHQLLCWRRGARFLDRVLFP